jgi:hypothetical protein
VTIGCDLGQRQDPTAICVTESQMRTTGKREVSVRHPDGSVTVRPEEVGFFAVRWLVITLLSLSDTRVCWQKRKTG